VSDRFADLADFDDAERRVDDWQGEIERQAAQATMLSRRVSGLTATARGGDGLVEVSVGSSGMLADLWLDERVRERSAAWIRQQILGTLAAAQRRLADQVREAVAETVGVDSSTGRVVLGSWPAREDPEAGRGAGR
jgi:DNA-binding protein YbaB